MSKVKGVWLPDGFDIERAHDVQAVAEGRATPEQQQRAIKYVAEVLCGVYDDTYNATSERESSRLQGRRQVGLAIVQIVKLNLGWVKKQLDAKTSKEKTK